MELLSVSQLRPGQTVAKAVTNRGGAVLCPPGFRLTATAIERLRNAGIDSVIVESLEDKAPEIQQRIHAIESRFADIDDPILLQIKATVSKRLGFLLAEQNEDA